MSAAPSRTRCFQVANSIGEYSPLANRTLLDVCGVPDAIADSDRQWAYVLLHGDDHLGTGWDVSWISPQQAAELLAALVHELPFEARYELVWFLRQRAEA